MPELWNQALIEVKERIGKQNYETWIKPIRFASRSKSEINLEVPNKFFRDWLTEHYLLQIEDVLSSLEKDRVRVVFEINEKLESRSTGNRNIKKEEKERERTSRNTNLIPKYTFDNFVIGASNQFAHAACVAVANQPGDHYNPLFIYGGVGLGKTHLVNAIGHHSVTQRPSLKVVYLSSESFMNELIASLRRDKMDEFKRKFRNVDILILDDVQFIAGKERTQEEFFHTFNSLYESHKQIVVTSDKFPKDMRGLEERLRSRFEWGLIADIQAPDIETKMAILKKKSEIDNIHLPDDVALFLASSSSTNIRELEGMLIRLGAYASLTGSSISLNMAREVLKDIIVDKSK